MIRRPWARAILAAALLAFAGPSLNAADKDKPAAPAPTSASAPASATVSAAAAAGAWEVGRVTSPDSTDELKALQARVKAVRQKALPTTVGLLLGGHGHGDDDGDKDEDKGVNCGSGVIVSADGLVLTAAHVIERSGEPIVFVLADGKRARGVSLGLNKVNDAGMARITDAPPAGYGGAPDGKWPFAATAPSDGLKKGQWLVSLGHPGGPKPDRPPPVRVGRYLGFEKAGRFQRNDLLNTDGLLVGGDSGGPLFDLAGTCVGIHSEIGETLDQNKHVPVEKFKAQWDRMARGDQLYNTPEERDRATKVAMNLVFDDAATGAARVEEVLAGGAAEKAGLLAGDVVAALNGKPVASADDLRSMLPGRKPGEPAKFDVVRNGTPIKIEMKFVERSRK